MALGLPALAHQPLPPPAASAEVVSSAAGGTAFSFDTVRERARALAAKDYRAEPRKLPDFLKNLNYDGYLHIRYRPETGPWMKDHLPFTLQFFHPGYLYQDPVRVQLIEQGRVHDFPFSPSQFDYQTNRFPAPVPEDLSFAGLRVLCPLNSPGKQDEVATFVGASYFRLLGAQQRYGISARALAIDTAEPSGEEFPRFTEFWVTRPTAAANTIELLALLDGPREAGAWRFVLKPGKATVAEVEASLFLRKDVRKVGLACMASMFLAGENRTRFVPDFRPEVHDSDGLLVHTGTGEWLWRPLVNPPRDAHVSHFEMDALQGFGLAQRDRDFHHYEDLGARYELRPTLWVQPQTTSGAGTVELVEIPSPNEWNDNIVAYWVPKQKPAAGQEFRWKYSLSALAGDPQRAPLLAVLSTLIEPPHDKKPPRFVIDFVGETVPPLPANGPLTAQVKASRGEIQNLVVQKNDVTGGWRVFFDLVAGSGEEVALRLFLQHAERVLSETWVYYWNP